MEERVLRFLNSPGPNGFYTIAIYLETALLAAWEPENPNLFESVWLDGKTKLRTRPHQEFIAVALAEHGLEWINVVEFVFHQLDDMWNVVLSSR